MCSGIKPISWDSNWKKPKNSVPLKDTSRRCRTLCQLSWNSPQCPPPHVKGSFCKAENSGIMLLHDPFFLVVKGGIGVVTINSHTSLKINGRDLKITYLKRQIIWTEPPGDFGFQRIIFQYVLLPKCSMYGIFALNSWCLLPTQPFIFQGVMAGQPTPNVLRDTNGLISSDQKASFLGGD